LPRFSRFCSAAVSWRHPTREPELLLESLLDFASAAGAPPVVFYQGDGDALFLSRNRERLRPHVRFVIPDAPLVESLVDKHRFQALARELALPVPPSATFTPAVAPTRDLEISFPALVKPVARQLATWQPLAGHAKAVQVESFEALLALWERAAELGTAVLVQRLIPGDETRVESYHVYVDADGRIAAEFTGRKVRTYPVRFGQSTALEITDEEDVRRLGAELVRRMELRGVAKLDFKRDPDGTLWLLEVNPRFSLWHHLAAAAGLNVPALAYADLTGTPRPQARAVAGFRWSRPLEDLKSVRASGGPVSAWLRWTLTAHARSGVSADDPMLMAGWAVRRVQRLVGRRMRPAALRSPV
jgi:predicted ATP-grasp superfamily ATP-dependent carboligase